MCNPLEEAEKTVDRAWTGTRDAVASTLNGVGKVVENVIKNPLPVVTMVAATWALGPSGLAVTSTTAGAAALAAGSIAAYNGKNVGDIAKSALLAYGGAEFAKFSNKYTGLGDLTTSIGNNIGGTTGSAVTSGLNNAFFNSSVAALGGKNVSEAFGAGFLGGAAGSLANSAMNSQTGQSYFGTIKESFGLNDSQMKYIQGGATAMGTAAISGQDPKVALTNYVAQNLAKIGKEEIGKQFTSAKNYFVDSYDAWKTAKEDQQSIIDRRNALYEEAKPIADQYTALISQYNDVANKLKADSDYVQQNRGGYDAAMAAYESNKSNETIDRVNAEAEKLKPYTDSFDKNKATYDQLEIQIKDLNPKLTDYSLRLNGFDSDIQASNDKITQLSDTFADAATKYESSSKQVGESLVGMAESDIRKSAQIQAPEPPAETEPPSGLQLAAGPSDTVSDAGNGYKVEVGGAPIYADSPNADKVKVPFGYDLMPSELNEKGTRPNGAYYDEILNAWLMPNNAAADLQTQLTGDGSKQTVTTSPGEEVISELKDTTPVYTEPSDEKVIPKIPPNIAPQDLGVTQESIDSSQATQKANESAGKWPAGYKANEDGTATMVRDDGSTTTINDKGDIVHTTEAPAGNLVSDKVTDNTFTKLSTTQKSTALDMVKNGIPLNQAVKYVNSMGQTASQPTQQDQQTQQISSGTTPSPLSPQYLTSKANKQGFVNPLSTYQKMVASDTAPLQPNPAPTQDTVQVSQGNVMPDYYSYGQNQSIDDILGITAKEGGLVTPLMAKGGSVQKYAEGGLSVPMMNHGGKMRGDFRHGAHVAGPGDGQSDNIPAMLADGEFVFPADVVSALGNGSTKAGSQKLYEMMHSIRDRARSKGPKDLPPPALKSPLDYLSKKSRS